MKLFSVANKYCKTSDWKIITALKFCLLSIGMIIGVLLPDAARSYVLTIGGIVFLFTYIPLMVKLIRLFRENSNGEKL